MMGDWSPPTPTMAKSIASFETDVTGVLIRGGRGSSLGYQNKLLLEKKVRSPTIQNGHFADAPATLTTE